MKFEPNLLKFPLLPWKLIKKFPIILLHPIIFRFDRLVVQSQSLPKTESLKEFQCYAKSCLYYRIGDYLLLSLKPVGFKSYFINFSFFRHQNLLTKINLWLLCVPIRWPWITNVVEMRLMTYIRLQKHSICWSLKF
jgi:hypothetical protein